MKVWRLDAKDLAMKTLMVGLRASPTVLECECNFPVHSLTCFLQLEMGSLKGLHSDRAWCSRKTSRWGEAYFIWVCCYLRVCVDAFGVEMLAVVDLLLHTVYTGHLVNKSVKVEM